jgi:hypothetical protein
MLAGSAYQDKTNELLDRVMGLAGAESVRGLLALREWT